MAFHTRRLPAAKGLRTGNRGYWLEVLCFAATVMLAACSNGLYIPAVTSEPTAPPAADIFLRGECPFNIQHDVEVECGFLHVPADYVDPLAGEIRLAVAIFRSPNPHVEADGVVYLGGGPGGHNLQTLPVTFDALVAPFLAKRDLIMLDQRGTGFSQPSLDCPEVTEAIFRQLDKHLPLTEELDLQLEAYQKCRDRFTEEGTDPAWFNTAANAADVDRLRAALGYEQWNVYGVGYGTRLAQTVMRDFPGGVRRMVLDSSYPLDMDFFGTIPVHTERIFQLLIDTCAADRICNADYPDLGAILAQAVQTLNRVPVPGVLTFPTTGETLDTLTSGEVLVNTIFTAFYQTVNLPLLPYVIYEAASGNVALVNALRVSELSYPEFISYGMNQSVQCQDEAPFTSEIEVTRNIAASPLYKSLLASEYLDLYYSRKDLAPCAVWDVPPSTQIENVAVVSDIPTLILAGEFDPVTPPAEGRAVASKLSQSTFIEFAGAGHGLLSPFPPGPCAASVITAFLDAQELDTACVSELIAPQWQRRPLLPPLAETLLVPYEDLATGFKGVAPAGWRELDSTPGYFTVGQAAFGQFFAPGISSDVLLGSFTTSLTEIERIRPVPADADGQGWRLFQGKDGSSVIVFAVADFGSVAVLVLVGGPQGQRDILIDVLLLPALAAVEPPN